MNNIVILSGSNGRVGSYLKKGFLGHGFDVAALQHDELYTRYSLPSESEVSAYKRILVIHSGQPSAPRSILARKRYIRSTSELIRDSNIRGYEFVFISTMSAHEGNRSNYSKEKRKLEKEVLKHSGSVVKFGLVTGVENSFSATLQKIETFLSLLGLNFLLTNANIFKTGPQELDVFIRNLAKGPLPSQYDFYYANEVFVDNDLGVIRGSIRRIILAFLWLSSSLGSGHSDALLNLFDGMKVIKS